MAVEPGNSGMFRSDLERAPERGDEAASEELLRQADLAIQNMERELARLRRAADLYRERQHGKRRNGH